MLDDREVRLLVVNDQKTHCDFLREQVELNSHICRIECQFTGSGQTALSMIKEWHPTVVLLDAYVEDINSFQVLEECRNGSASIIVTSEHNSCEIEKSALKGGARGYCTAVDDPEGVERLIEQIIKLADAASRLQ